MVKKEYTFTYKDFSDRKRKNLTILDTIRRNSPISRTDISKHTGINIVSVSNYILNYIKRGLVLESGLDISSGGRRPELVKLNLESANVVGVDIGPEKLVVIVGDLGLNVKAKKIFPRPLGKMNDVLKGTVDALEVVFKEFNLSLAKIKVIGIGASGVIDIYTGTIHDTDPLRGRTRTDFYNLARFIEQKFDVPTYVGNDATCAAFGELSFNPRSDISEMLYVYSDVGCGIIINSDIYCGASGSAGEIQLFANARMQKDEPLGIASYGIRGVDLGVVGEAREMIEKGGASGILRLADGKIEAVTKETVFDAAKQGDEAAKDILQNAGHWLGVKVAYLVNVFNPQLVAIGGGVEKSGNIFMDALTECVKMYAFEETFNAVKILPSFLGEDAIALGAVALGIRELFLNT
ncbi:MAG: ROK family protein [Candidatus Omnitrophica bacterium]|nr:ROK family protein [Candidatus Omnitrophota bacterium]